VVPGFYGAGAGGGVQTFSRGGSDITGAIVARASGSGIYENWTDVCGFLMADPRVVADPKPMRRLTYGEMRRLASMGANVFHEDAVFPVLAAGIPVNIRNTNLPEDPGTLVVAERDDGGGVVGIAGKRDRVGLILEKAMLNLKRDLLKRLLEVLEGLGLHPEALGLSADAVRLILSGSELKGREAVLEQRLRQELGLDRFELESGLALIACVGQGIAGNPGVLARLFLALEREGIGLKLVSAGTTELGVLIGVNDRDFEQALRSIYREFA
jgi:aspartate kinase